MLSHAAKCPACGSELTPNARFCNTCGATIAASGAATAVTGPTMALSGPPAPTSAGELPAGTLLGANRRYRIERSLGRGGFGQTYLASDLQLKRQCVVKRMLLDPAWGAPEQQLARDNFVREAELLANLATPGHANIPEIYEYLADSACLVLKYIAGRDLGELSGALRPTKAIEYVRDICSALEYMHSRVPPVLHRDIKPANLLLANNGQVWLIDFGLSRSAPLQPAAQGTPAGASLVLGTLGYTPPEQWQGAAVAESDIYALAATLHTLLTGHVPTFTAADLPGLLAGSLGAFPPAHSLNPAVDRRVEALIQRGMAFDPARRPSAREFLHELNRILQPAAGGSRIITPTGQSIAALPELARWCATNWYEACEWLQGNLADVIETGFLDAYTAKKVREARSRHRRDLNAALDLVIELLDPATPRSASVRVMPEPIDFGGLAPGGPPVPRQITVENTGQRYLALTIKGEGWLCAGGPTPASQIELQLLPGGMQAAVVYALAVPAGATGKLSANLLISSHNGLSDRSPAQASLPRWKAPWAASPTTPMQPAASGPAGKSRYLPYKTGLASAPTRTLKKSQSGNLLILLALVFMVYACAVMVRNSNRSLHDSAGLGTPQARQIIATVPAPPEIAPTAATGIVVPALQPAPTPSAEPATPTEPERRQARITGAQVLNIRAEPRASSADIGDLLPDSVFELTGEESAGWYRIRAGATEGWVNGRYVEILP